jgi:hypothetical protein
VAFYLRGKRLASSRAKRKRHVITNPKEIKKRRAVQNKPHGLAIFAIVEVEIDSLQRTPLFHKSMLLVQLHHLSL